MLKNEFVNYGVYSMYDETMEQFGFPFIAENDSQVLRKCAADFLLYDDVVLSDVKVFEIGQFDPITGKIDGYSKDSYHLSCTGTDILAKIKSYRIKIKEAEDLARKEIDELKNLKSSKEVE